LIDDYLIDWHLGWSLYGPDAPTH